MCDGCCSVSKMTTKKVARKLRANVVVRGGGSFRLAPALAASDIVQAYN